MGKSDDELIEEAREKEIDERIGKIVDDRLDNFFGKKKNGGEGDNGNGAKAKGEGAGGDAESKSREQGEPGEKKGLLATFLGW